MKPALRNFVINLLALWLTTQILPALVVDGGALSYLKATIAFMLSNLMLVPLLRVLFLPLNLLTVGIFSWVVNVLALYLLVTIVPSLRLLPFSFSGYNFSGFIIPSIDFSVFQVAIIASFLISFLIHLLKWLFSK